MGENELTLVVNEIKMVKYQSTKWKIEIYKPHWNKPSQNILMGEQFIRILIWDYSKLRAKSTWRRHIGATNGISSLSLRPSLIINYEVLFYIRVLSSFSTNNLSSLMKQRCYRL